MVFEANGAHMGVNIQDSRI